MWHLVVKVYLRHFDGDERYRIEDVYCYDSQLGYWLANPKTWDRELMSYSRC